MVRKAMYGVALILCLNVTSLATTIPVFAGNGSSRPATPIVQLTLEEALTQFGGLMGQSREAIVGQYKEGKDTSIPGLAAMLNIYTYELVRDGSKVAFNSREANATPIGVMCSNAGLGNYTIEDVKRLLGEPQTQKTAEDGLVEFGYDPLAGSLYLQNHVSFKFSEDRLLRFAVEVQKVELDIRK